MSVAATGLSAVRLRETSLDDYKQVSGLTLRNGIDSPSEAEWRHVWVDNPEYQRHSRWPVGWVLEDANGKVVGSLGNVPLSYEFEGKRLVAASGRTWVVDEQYRGYATILTDQYFRQKGVDLFINNTINQNAEQAFAAFGSVRVPVGCWNRSSFWITDYAGFAASALRAKHWKYPGLLARPVGVALYCRDILKARPSPRNREVRFENGFDERFDLFWEELRARNPSRLLGVRNQETLAWHFHNLIAQKQAYILTVSEKDRILAYMIFDRRDHHEIKLKRVRLADYQSLDEDRTLLEAMLAGMLRKCGQQGIHIVEDVGCCIDWAVPPHQRDLSSWSFCYKATSKALAGKLQDPSVWRPSLYDGDATL